MFERPDADYLQDLLAGYVLGTLDRVERHYLEEQMARDPKLQRVLYQLEQALETVEKPSRSDRISPTALPPVKRRTAPVPAPERRRAKWVVVLSALAAVGAMSVSLPWLRQRYDLPQFVSDWIPRQAEAPQSLTTWDSLKFLLEDHSRVQATQAEQSQTSQPNADITATELDEAYITLEQVFAETVGIQALTHDDVRLLRGSYYEQPHLHGLRLTYRLGPQNPATADTVLTIYQLQPRSDAELWLDGQVFIESSNGTNLLVWRADAMIYAIAAQLTLDELRLYADALAPL